MYREQLTVAPFRQYFAALETLRRKLRHGEARSAVAIQEK